MRVVHGRPPNFDEIVAVLPAASAPDTLFCYGDTIYNTGDGRLPHTLRAHESVHSRRQGKSDEAIRTWWRHYVSDARFRFDEELPAHRAEYAAFCAVESDKEKRFRFLVTVARRLCGPLYGGLVDFASAKRAIKEAA